MDVLKDLFDNKIISILDIFLENPNKAFSLTEISNISKVNVTASFRIINKLVKKNFLKTIPKQKTKVYQLENNEKTKSLLKILEKDYKELESFIEFLIKIPTINKIILDSKNKDNAKIIIIGKIPDKSEINDFILKIKDKSGFLIEYIEISEEQFETMKNFDNFKINQNIIWTKKQD